MGKIVLPPEHLTYKWAFGLYLVRTSSVYCDFEVELKLIVLIHELDCHKLYNFVRITISLCNTNRCHIDLALS
jgi:hypothetical protein